MNDFAVDPRKTRAVVIAIEEYELPKPFNSLPGPANDAARFITWLIGQGVEADQIDLLASPLKSTDGTTDTTSSDHTPTGEQALARTGVPWIPPTRQNIHDIFSRKYIELQGDLLWVYWGGHGLMAGAGMRRLLTSDARQIDVENVDLESLLACLHSKLFAGWPRQIVAVDACATHYLELPSPLSFPERGFVAAIRQFALFAAAPGEAAMTSGVRRSGVFSDALLDEIENSKPGVFPPDMKSISTSLISRFTALREQGLTLQTPTTYEQWDWAGSRLRFGEIPPNRSATETRVEPRYVTNPDDLSPELRDKFVAALLSCPTMADPSLRGTLIKNLRRDILIGIRYSEDPLSHVTSIVWHCLAVAGGLEELVQVLWEAEGSTTAMRNVERIGRLLAQDREAVLGLRRPLYRDAESRDLANKLSILYRELKKESISENLTNISFIRKRITNIRRELRKAGQPQAGEIFSERYELLQNIGAGGFATVWRAWDHNLHILVVLKILHAKNSDNKSSRDRFVRGSEIMARLTHTNIARVIAGLTEDDGHYYFVLEYFEGGNFQEAILNQSLGPKEIAKIILDIGSALQYAHDQGILHRDVKPSNILLDRKGRAVLTDFDLVLAPDTTGGTGSDVFLGTYVYSAPECAAGANVDARCDVYSLGMTMLFGLYGQELPPPVVRDSGSYIAATTTSGLLRAVLRRSLEWRRDLRYQSARAFCEDIRRVMLPDSMMDYITIRLKESANLMKSDMMSFFMITCTSILLFFLMFFLVAEQSWGETDASLGPQAAFVVGDIGARFIPLPVLEVLPQIDPEAFPPPSIDPESGSLTGGWIEKYGFIERRRQDLSFPEHDKDLDDLLMRDSELRRLPVGFTLSSRRPFSPDPSPIRFVGLACAACHSARFPLTGPSGRIVYGAGNPSLDLAGFFEAIRRVILRRTPSNSSATSHASGLEVDVEYQDQTDFLTLSLIIQVRNELGIRRLSTSEQTMIEMWIRGARTVAERQATRKDLPPSSGEMRLPRSNSLGPGRLNQSSVMNDSLMNLSVKNNYGMTKIPAVFGQQLRRWAQCDGSLADFEARSGLSAIVAGASVDDLGGLGVAGNVMSATDYTTHGLAGPRWDVFFGIPSGGPPAPNPPDAEAARLDEPQLRGRIVYRRYCADCHGSPDPDGKRAWLTEGKNFGKIVPAIDPFDAANGPPISDWMDFPNRESWSRQTTDPERVVFRDAPVMPFAVFSYFDRDHPVKSTGEYYPLFHPLALSRPSIRNTAGYVNAPLESLFLRAPYLHNGSVPTLAQLINLERRPDTFRRGKNAYDVHKAGLDAPEAPIDFVPKPGEALYWIFDTSQRGNHNYGHNYPWAFDDPAKDTRALTDLLAYLKTL